MGQASTMADGPTGPLDGFAGEPGHHGHCALQSQCALRASSHARTQWTLADCAEAAQPRALVQKAERVRSTPEGPFVAHHHLGARCDFFRVLAERELAQKPILVLLEESGVKVGRAEQTISARSGRCGHGAVTWMFPLGSALLAVRRLIYDVQDDRPVQWLHGPCTDRTGTNTRCSYPALAASMLKVWVSQGAVRQLPLIFTSNY